MRVIAGSAKGTTLKTPEGMRTRPTTDRVKEALFSILQFDLPGASVLDLFGGTGQLGIEALSRGASRAVFVDEQETACRLIRENLKKTHLEDRAEVVCCDYMTYLANCRKRFRVVFLDPPYAENYLENAIKRISEIDILAEGAIIVSERPLGKPLDEEFPGLVRSKDYHYGKTTVTLFRRERDVL